MTLQEILSRLKGVKGHDGQYTACCPAHDDKNASLSVSVGKDNRVLLHCHAGCAPEDIAWAMNLEMKDLFAENRPGDVFPSYGEPKKKERSPVVATYTYPNGAQKLRRADKSFTWRQPDGKGGWIWSRNGLKHTLFVAGALSETVFIAEGEKDALTLNQLGLDAACGEDGAGPGKWRREYTEQLRGLHVCVLQDNDETGKAFAAETCNALSGAVASVKLLDLSRVWPEIPEHGDVTDMVVALGPYKAGELIGQLSMDTPEWTPVDAAPGDGPAYRTAKTAAEFQEADTKFLWYPYLPIGDYSVMMADGGTGKTILCCGISAVITAGERFPGESFAREPQNVLIISAEDTGEVLRKRLKKSGADLKRVHIIDCMDSEGMNISERYDEFLATIQHYAPSLAIIDPWHAFLGERVDIGRVNALRPNLQKLANIAKKCNCAMVLVSHVNKRAQGENANNAATGSTDFINAARSAFRVIFDGADDDCRIMVHTKANYAPYGPSVKYRIDGGGVVWVGFSDVTRATLEAAARKHSTPYETMMSAEKRAGINAALIEAIKKSANPFTATRLTYDEFKEKHGDLIFGGLQPKRALDAVKKVLAEDGYFLKTGVLVRRGTKRHNGFLLQHIEDVEAEQIEIEGSL